MHVGMERVYGYGYGYELRETYRKGGVLGLAPPGFFLAMPYSSIFSYLIQAW